MRPDWERAVRGGDPAQMQQILESLRDASLAREIIDSKDRHGQTALLLAAKLGHTSVTEFLLAAGAELNHTAKFNLSALMLAVINNHAAIVRMLMKAGADTAIKGSGAPGFFDKTALDLAKAAGNQELVETLSGTRRA